MCDHCIFCDDFHFTNLTPVSTVGVCFKETEEEGHLCYVCGEDECRCEKAK